MNTTNKIAMAIVAVAVPLIAIAAIYNFPITPTQTDSFAQSGLVIDFTVYPANEEIVLERGKSTEIPLKVNALNDVERTLQVRVVYDRFNVDPRELEAELTEPTLLLRKIAVAEGESPAQSGIITRDAGTLILTPTPEMSPGIYTIGVEAEQQIDSTLADKLVSGTVVTIEVR